MTDAEIEDRLEAAFRALPAPANGSLPRHLCAPYEIERLLVLHRNGGVLDVRSVSPKTTQLNLLAIRKRVDIIQRDARLFKSLPPEWQKHVRALSGLSVTPRKYGAPVKANASIVAEFAAERFYALTDKYPTVRVSVRDNKAYGPFLELLRNIFEILQFEGVSAESQARTAITKFNKKYPRK